MSRHTHQATATQQKISNFLFPEPSSPTMPDGFMEFCRDSMQSLRGGELYTDPTFSPEFSATQFDGADGQILHISKPDIDHLRMLDAVPTRRPVVAIDTSTIKLGELENGALCALRGAVVILDSKHYRYYRYGPFLFSLGYSTPLASKCLANLGLPPFSGEPNVDSLLKRLRNILERWLQLNTTASVRDAFVLIDGSLTAGTPDNPSRDLEHILEVGHRSGNSMIAISKKTKLRIGDAALTNLLDHELKACLLDVDSEVTEQFPPYPVRFLGRVFVAKLARNGFPFRVDIDREISAEGAVEELSELAGTDIVDQGYPETLRMAHVLSTFTATDVLAMQVLAETEYGIQMTPRLALRHSLFGPFGTSWEVLH